MFYIHLQGCTVMNAVIHIPGYSTTLMALTGMLRRFKIPVTVIPGQQHRLTDQLFRLDVRNTHGCSVIRYPFVRLKFYNR